jgi:PAS domain S-box-containing protein
MDIDALLRQLEQLTDSFQPAPDLTSENSQQTIYEIHRILQQASQQIVALVGANPTSLEQTPVQTSSALSESQAYLRAMFDSVQEYAIFTVDLNNRITTWNSGAERLFRFSEQEALGQSSAIIFTPEDRAEQAHQQELQEASIKGRAEDERWHIRKDGTRFFASGVLQEIVDQAGNRRGFIKVARDITGRKRAEVAEYEQRHLAEALREIAFILTKNLNLNKVLEAVLATVGRLVPHDNATLFLVEQEVIANIRGRGFVPKQLAKFEAMMAQYELNSEQVPLFNKIIESKQPLVIADVKQDETWLNSVFGDNIRAFVGVPLIGENRTLGVLSLTSHRPEAFTEQHLHILDIFAAQAAIAVHNAQLFLRSQELAALNERHRLARDLHDAVSQTLFSAKSIAETAVHIWDKDPVKTRGLVEMLEPLLHGAHAEMRVLLSELRPTNLTNTPLSRLFQQLVDALNIRKQIDIKLAIEDEPELTPEIHLGLYRIVQEALNNISKHSHASTAYIEFKHEDGYLKLRIVDNGRGFALERKHSGVGLHMMRERAEGINALLEITSQPQGGTEIVLIWPNPTITGMGDE